MNTLFLLDAGLNIFGVMIANAGYTVGQVLFEVPTGVIADTVGRRVSYLLSVAIVFASTVLYLVFGTMHAGVVPFVLASMLLGLGFTFYTGAVDAWMVDALETVGYKGRVDTIFARGGIAFGVAMIIGTTGGGLLGQLNLGYPYIARAVLLVPAFLLGLLAMKELGFHGRPLRLSTFGAETRKIARAGITYGVRNPVVRPLMLSSFVVGTFFIFGFYSWQKYFLDLLDKNLVWVNGVIAALVGLSGIAGNALVGRVSRRGVPRVTVLYAAVVCFAAGAVLAAVFQNFWAAVPLYLVSTLAFGVWSPVKQGWLNDRIPGAQRATIISLDSLFMDAGGTVGQLGLGYYAKVVSIPAAWLVGGAFQLVSLPLAWRAARADRLSGEPVTPPGPSAEPQPAPTPLGPVGCPEPECEAALPEKDQARDTA